MYNSSMKSYRLFFSLLFLLSTFFLTACDQETEETESFEEFCAFFETHQLHEIRFSLTQEEWNAITNDLWQSSRDWPKGRGGLRYEAEILRLCDFENLSDGSSFQSAGLRVRGNTSRYLPVDFEGNYHWVHWKIDFNEEFERDESIYGSPLILPLEKATDELYQCKALNFRYPRDDSTFVREAYCFWLFERLGVLVPKVTFAHLNIQIGESEALDWGIYEIYEPIDKEFIRRRFSKNGFLFKCLNQDTRATLRLEDLDETAIGMEKTAPEAAYEMSYFVPYHPAYDLKTKRGKLLEGAALLSDFISNINLLSGKEFETYLEKNFQTTEFLTVMAVDALVGQTDGYWNNGNNYYLFLNPENDKWTFIPYDYDMTFHYGENRSFSSWGEIGILATKMLKRKTYMEEYQSIVSNLISEGGLFTPEQIESDFKSLQAVFSEKANAVETCFDDGVGFSEDLSEILTFSSNRIEKAREEFEFSVN